MFDYYIRSVDEQSFWSALEQAGLARKQYDPEDPLNQRPADADETWEPTGSFFFVPLCQLDVIGTIYKPTGETGEDGETTMAPIPGFHANLRGVLTAEQQELLPLIEQPQMPYRVWA